MKADRTLNRTKSSNLTIRTEQKSEVNTSIQADYVLKWETDFAKNSRTAAATMV
jgi:hypothetical protein